MILKNLLLIRIKQLYRSLSGLGIARILVLVAVGVYVGVTLYTHTEKAPNSTLAAATYFCLVASIHFKRRDITFLRIHSMNPRAILLTEYLALSAPLLVLLTHHKQWPQLLAYTLLLLPLACAQVRFGGVGTRAFLNRYIPSSSFEWKSGVRSWLLLMLPIWVLAFFTPHLTWTVPAALLIIGILCISFYEVGESLPMLLAPELGPKGFLAKKVKHHIAIYTVVVLPLSIAYIGFHPSLWFIPVLGYLLFTSIHIYAILIKYTFYRPNQKSSASQVFGAIGVMGIILPFIIPVVWALAIYFYFRSKENLNQYLYDYH